MGTQTAHFERGSFKLHHSSTTAAVERLATNTLALYLIEVRLRGNLLRFRIKPGSFD